MDLSELKLAVDSLKQEDEEQDQIWKLIGQVDTDHNQRLSFKEFIDLVQTNKHEQDEDQRFRRLFHQVSGDQLHITYEDLQQLVRKISSGLSLAALKEMFAAADLNKDGVVDYPEFKALMQCK